MKKKEVFLVIILIVFGFIYYSIHNIDFGFIREGNFSFESTRLASKYYNEFQENVAVFPNVSKIIINNAAGNVFIEKSNDSNVTCQVYARIYYQNKNKAEALWNSISVLKEVSGSELDINIKSSSRFIYNRIRVFFFLKVPSSVSISIMNSLGDVTIKGTGKEIKIKEDFGSVKVRDIQGNVQIDSIYGDIFAKNIKGRLKIKSQFSQIFCEKVDIVESESKHGAAIFKEVLENSRFVLNSGSLLVESSKNVEIKANDANIIAKDVLNNLKISNSNEKIDLERINGNVYLDASNCKILLKDCVSDKMEIKNSNESIIIERFTGGNVNLSSKYGRIGFHFLKIKESININSSYSDIGIQFPNHLKPSFYIKYEFGKIVNMTSIVLNPIEDRIKPHLHLVEESPHIIIDSIYGNISIENK